MALSYSVPRQTVMGNMRMATGTISFDSSYSTGGLAFDPAQLGMSSIELIVFAPTSGVVFEFDHSNVKVKAFFPTGGAGTPGSALATASGLAASGASTASAVDATRPTVALLPGVGTEVPASQNLSTLTGVRFFAVGR